MRDRLSTRLAASVGTALALLVGGAAVASAQSDGVVVDPESPAGKEYALPLESARRDAAGGGGSAAPSDQPLFGAGISPRDSGRGDAPARGDGGGPNGKAEPRGRGSGDSRATGSDVGRAVAQAVADGGSGLSAGALTTLIALGVLLVGGAIGLSLRALRGRDQPR